MKVDLVSAMSSPNLKALWVTVGGSRQASTRVRVIELSHGLRKFGVESTILRGTDLKGRLRVVLRVMRGRYDVIVLQKVLYGWPMLWLLRKMTGELVFECDDAIHLPDSQGEMYSSDNDLRRLRRLLRRVDVVTTTNQLLAEDFATKENRTVVYAGPAPPIRSSRKREKVVLWLGSPSTSPELDEVAEVPAALGGRGIEFVAVGADVSQAERGWEVLDWSIEVADEWLQRATVGLMPLARNPWNDRKAAYKILQYAASGVVPVASEGPPARLFLPSEMNECLVSSRSGWCSAIEAGLEGADKYAVRLDMIVNRNSVGSTAEKWFHQVIEKGVEV